ncbi:hypothetical protein QYZ45_17480 [Vibrio parahaemolyticus]|nr:hypothetical protein [Vibrio parahaemolyticus]
MAGKTSPGTERWASGIDQLAKSSPVFKGAAAGAKAITKGSGKLGKARSVPWPHKVRSGAPFKEMSQ